LYDQSGDFRGIRSERGWHMNYFSMYK